MEQIRLAFGAKDPNPAIRRLTQAGVAALTSSRATRRDTSCRSRTRIPLFSKDFNV